MRSMHTIALVLTSTLTLAGEKSANSESSETPSIVAIAKQAVLAKLRDPYSAKLDHVQRKTTANVRGEPTDVVCGSVNAKNAFGGYVGAAPFVYLVKIKKVYIAGAGQDWEIDVVRNFCAAEFNL